MKYFFQQMRNYYKIVIGVMIALILAGSALYFVYHRMLVKPFPKESFVLYVDSSTTYSQLMDSLEVYVDSSMLSSFSQLAQMRDLSSKLKPGAYQLDGSMSAVDVYKTLSRGLQTPVRVTFNNVRTPEQFAKRISEQLMMDSLDVIQLFSDSTLIHDLGFTPATFPSLFLPDSYEFYWTVSPEMFVARMKKEHDRFWNSSRREKAKKMGLDPTQMAIVASIAEEETNNAYERGVVGRLYINRVQRGMYLQADPTVKYALGDFTLRRILYKHLEIDSPYNTYKYIGLPPGPIRIPSKATLDAILNSKPHKYLYMCAKEDFSGLHNFATTYREHQRNANRYRNALNRRGVK